MLHVLLLILYAALFVLGMVLAAVAPTEDIKIVGIGIAIVTTAAVTLSARRHRKQQSDAAADTAGRNRDDAGPSGPR